jgi:hypothetical protein
VAAGPPRLARISNPVADGEKGASTVSSTVSTRASAGASLRRRRAKSASRASGPSASMVTPALSLRTQPASPSSFASR